MYKKLILFMLILISVMLSGCNEAVDRENSEAVKDDIVENVPFKDCAGKTFDESSTSKHFEIYYEKANDSDKIYAKSILLELENNYDRILNFFKLKEGSLPTVKVYLYPNYEQFRSSVLEEISFDVDNISGIVGYTLGPDKFYLTYENRGYITDIAVHEFVHCVTFNITYSELIPTWLFEGVAMYLSQDKDKNADFYPNFAENGLPQLDELNGYSNRYFYGYSLAEYIYMEFGKEKLLELVRGGTIENVLKLTEDEFREGWKSYIIEKVDLKNSNAKE